MTVDGLQDRLPGPKVAEIVAHDVHVVALGIERGDAPLGALLAVVAVIVVGADVRDLLLAEDADEAAGEGRLARRRVADDAEYGWPGQRSRSLLVSTAEDAALQDVLGFDRDQLVPLEHAIGLEQPARLAQACPIDGVADAAGVREARVPPPSLDVLAENRARLVRERVRPLIEHQV